MDLGNSIQSGRHVESIQQGILQSAIVYVNMKLVRLKLNLHFRGQVVCVCVLDMERRLMLYKSIIFMHLLPLLLLIIFIST